MVRQNTHWRQVAESFHKNADQYDQWYEDNLVFHTELAAIKALSTPLLKPQCEVGIGTGRFADALSIPLGIDPSPASLALANKRGISVCHAIGEDMPIRTGSLGTLFLLFTFCFLNNPDLVVQECFRVLAETGRLVIGIINAASPWGKSVNQKKEKGHLLYRFITLYTPDTIQKMLEQSGFSVIETRSALFQPPERITSLEKSYEGVHKEAGFILFVAGKK